MKIAISTYLKQFCNTNNTSNNRPFVYLSSDQWRGFMYMIKIDNEVCFIITQKSGRVCIVYGESTKKETELTIYTFLVNTQR